MFRTLINDCPMLIIPLVNEMFGELYTSEEAIIFTPNEHFLNQQGGLEKKRITDTCFLIIGQGTRRYHLECQATLDSRIPGGHVCYSVPAMQVQNYEIEEIFEKGLLFLIPFYIFSYESRFGKINEDMDTISAMREEFVRIDEFYKQTIMDMTERVIANLTRKFENIRKGVQNIMVGQVLEYEAKTILNRGIARGMKRGIEQG